MQLDLETLTKCTGTDGIPREDGVPFLVGGLDIGRRQVCLARLIGQAVFDASRWPEIVLQMWVGTM